VCLCVCVCVCVREREIERYRRKEEWGDRDASLLVSQGKLERERVREGNWEAARGRGCLPALVSQGK
jgi:hypothetical protein